MSEGGNLSALLPLVTFMVFMVGISIFVRWQQRAGFGGSFLRQYFVGNRDLGGFVLAMTTVATYSSVSSFVGGPGMAWKVGFGWIYMAVVQVTAVFLVLGIFGKRVALLSRKFRAVTVVDIIRERFRSDLVASLAAFVIVLFFCATMTAQFVGGAKLFAAVTGYSYEAGLVLFGLVVVVYTTIGGFRAVAITDACCAVMMMIGIVLLLSYVLDAGGGYEAIMAHIAAHEPAMLEPFGASNPAHRCRGLHEHRRQLHGHPRSRRAHGQRRKLRRRRQHHPDHHRHRHAEGAGRPRHHRAALGLHLHHIEPFAGGLLGHHQGRLSPL